MILLFVSCPHHLTLSYLWAISHSPSHEPVMTTVAFFFVAFWAVLAAWLPLLACIFCCLWLLLYCLPPLIPVNLSLAI